MALLPAPFPTAGVTIDLLALCNDCHVSHAIQSTPRGFLEDVSEWEVKHRGHDIEFVSERRVISKQFDDRRYQALDDGPWWLSYSSNANLKLAYAASAAITCSLATGPLASSSSFVAGRESTSIDNTSGLYFDYSLTAKITTGTTPTANTEIRLYGYKALNDTPTYPDTITGSDANCSITNTQILDNGFVLVGATTVSGTSNIGYPIRCLTAAEAFGHAAHRWGLFVAHNTVAALNATAGNHTIVQKGVYVTST